MKQEAVFKSNNTSQENIKTTKINTAIYQFVKLFWNRWEKI
jgi:hypothetical protein